MVSQETKISLAFVALGVVLWYVTFNVVDESLWAWIVLIAVGVLAPSVINERRRDDSRSG
ncbi:hypothetical protein G9464_00570 [Halostella sp. JP-L12]|uniref:hypothetical protein n=1 Tax=Halostella TaxID=1843185 RepID=UPI000EF7E769|nr:MULTISPECIES: hypothetical protein [Halostella]NHN46091.1 hypothetical protein [Halostella sp. JP-L12]